MGEIFSFREGSAYIITGGASALVTYARDITLQVAVGRYSYRPPHAATYTYIETARAADLTIGQAYSDAALAKLTYGAAGGAVNVHLTHLVGGLGTTGGFWLYSGELQTLSLDGQDGRAEQGLSLRGRFTDWSAY